jgi:hypothetical protein
MLNQPDEGHGLVGVLDVTQTLVYQREALKGEARLGVAAAE